MSNPENLDRALEYALALRKKQPSMSRLEAADEASKQFNLGPLDADWLLNHLTPDKPAE